MSLIITLSIVLGSYVGICSTIILIEQAYDKRVKSRKITVRHFQWLWDSGMRESADIVNLYNNGWRRV